jgi:hypothetical protein
MANVEVQAHRDDSFADQIGATQSYMVDLTNGLLIESGFSTDRIVLDADLGVPVTVRGMQGDDELIVMGKGAASGVYVPGAATVDGLDDIVSFSGTIVAGATTINFEEFETTGEIVVRDFTSFTLTTPNSSDALFVNGGAGRNTISGASDSVGIVPLTFFNVNNFVVDAAANDSAAPNDTIRLNGNFVATGLQNFTMNTGAGADKLINNSSNLLLPVLGGALTFNAGTGSDEVDDQTGNNNIWNITAVNTGNLNQRLLFNSVENLTSGAGTDQFRFLAGSLAGVVNGGGGTDTLDFSLLAAQDVTLTALGAIDGFDGTAPGAIGGSFQNINKIVGSATALDDSLTGLDADATWRLDATNTYTSTNTLEFANFEVLNGGSEEDIFDVITLAVATALNGNGGDDRFNIATGDLDTVMAKVTITGGTGDDRILLDDDGTADPVRYLIDATSATSKDQDCLDRAFKGITYDASVEALTVNGTQGANEFIVAPSATTELFINGNLPAAGGTERDYLEIVFDGTTDRKLERAGGDGRWTFGNRQDVNFTSIEKFNFFAIVATGADAGGGPHVKVFDAETLTEIQSFFAYSPLFLGGVRVATGDINDDGIPDIITAAGPTGGPHVRVFDAASGQTLADYGVLGSFFAFDPRFATRGVYVATGDFNPQEDDFDDIVVATIVNVADDPSTPNRFTAQPHVRVLSGRDGHELASFATKGVRIAVGNLNNDGIPDIITTPEGPGVPPVVELFDGLTGKLFPSEMGSFFAYNPLFRGGLYVAAGDVNGDGTDDIITGAGTGGGPHVRVFSGLDHSVLTEFFAYNPGFLGGVRVGAADLDGDGFADIVTGAGPGGGPHVRVISGFDGSDLGQRFAYSPLFTGGIFVAAHEETSSAEPCPPALVAADGQLLSTPPAAAIDDFQLGLIVAAAIQRFQNAGLPADFATRLGTVDVDVDGLPGDELVRLRGGRILVDSNAAGHGWFVDPTALLDEEFTLSAGGVLTATAGSAAEGRLDLLSAVIHELGHVMGLDDVDVLVDPASIMADELLLGVRHVPNAFDVDAVFAEGEF